MYGHDLGLESVPSNSVAQDLEEPCDSIIVANVPSISMNWPFERDRRNYKGGANENDSIYSKTQKLQSLIRNTYESSFKRVSATLDGPEIQYFFSTNTG